MPFPQQDPNVVVRLLLERNGNQRELPFVVGVLADLWGDTDPSGPLSARRFSEPVTAYYFDELVRTVTPTLQILLQGNSRSIELKFQTMYDFTAEGLRRQLRSLGESAVTEILKDERFHRLESAWRNLFLFVSATDTSPLLQIRVLPVQWRELVSDLIWNKNTRASAIYQRVCADWVDNASQDPFSLLVSDFAIGATAETVNVFERLALIASEANAPVLSVAASFGELQDAIKESEAWRLYQQFREKQEAEYAVLLAPLQFQGNAAYGLATRVTQAFGKYHWCAAITDNSASREQVDQELYRQGLAAVRPNGNDFALPRIPCCKKLKALSGNCQETEFFRLRSELPYFLCATRLAQYVKVLVRDSTRQHSSDEWSRILTQSLAQYYAGGEQPNARRLLREGLVEIKEQAGHWVGIAFLQPWYQLEAAEMGLAIRLKFPLPSGRVV